MDPALQDLLRALRENAETAKSIRVELDDAYLRRIAEVEARPENQSGSDKSGMWLGSHWKLFRDARIAGPFEP